MPGEYAEILSVHADDKSPVQADIEKDVTRTFPSNVYFGGDGHGVPKLRRVLLAYAWRNPNVGYCQGMNVSLSALHVGALLSPYLEQYWLGMRPCAQTRPCDVQLA